MGPAKLKVNRASQHLYIDHAVNNIINQIMEANLLYSAQTFTEAGHTQFSNITCYSSI